MQAFQRIGSFATHRTKDPRRNHMKRSQLSEVHSFDSIVLGPHPPRHNVRIWRRNPTIRLGRRIAAPRKSPPSIVPCISLLFRRSLTLTWISAKLSSGSATAATAKPANGKARPSAMPCHFARHDRQHFAVACWAMKAGWHRVGVCWPSLRGWAGDSLAVIKSAVRHSSMACRFMLVGRMIFKNPIRDRILAYSPTLPMPPADFVPSHERRQL